MSVLGLPTGPALCQEAWPVFFSSPTEKICSSKLNLLDSQAHVMYLYELSCSLCGAGIRDHLLWIFQASLGSRDIEPAHQHLFKFRARDLMW